MTPGIRREKERAVEIPIPTTQRRLIGMLSVPPGATGIVLFAHGSGSGRLSPRNQFVAQSLQDVGLGTLLLDLLEEDEAQDRRKVFDIDLLADRLQAAADWLDRDSSTHHLRHGYFGASTGAGAALVAAARRPELVRAIVSRGGRPDLAGDHLANVLAPTLLIVGGYDYEVIELNRQALALLRSPSKLVIVPKATHLFPEPGALEEVAQLAAQWFQQHLGARARDLSAPSKAGVEGQLGDRFPKADMDVQC
jgi:putative phosphoribosyl transferase